MGATLAKYGSNRRTSRKLYPKGSFCGQSNFMAEFPELRWGSRFFLGIVLRNSARSYPAPLGDVHKIPGVSISSLAKAFSTGIVLLICGGTPL